MIIDVMIKDLVIESVELKASNIAEYYVNMEEESDE